VKTRIYGAYTLQHYANKRKVKKILEIIREYRRTAQNIAKFLWREFFKNGYFPHKMSISSSSLKNVKSSLSQSYKHNCLWQVVAVLNSYIANIQNQFVRIVWKSTLMREDKLILLALNKVKGWLKYEKETVVIYDNDNKEKKEVKVQNWHKQLAKHIFKRLLKRNRRPRFKNISMCLDGKVVELVPRKKNGAKSFDYWLKISSVEKRKPIFIPLKKNVYAENLEGEFKNFFQIIEDDGRIVIRVIKELKRKLYNPETEAIAIDIGLNPLFATSNGDLFGRKFMQIITKMDRKITNRMAHLQRKGMQPSADERYRELVRKLREFLKNEINRYLNRLVKIYRPRRIVIEKLDFRTSQLFSSRMNRLIRNFGMKFIKAKLQRLNQFLGIEIIEVNAAYSSQQCHSCGYVHKKNRRNTQEFKCKFCGKKCNAQVNSAKNLLERSSLKEFNQYLPKKKILEMSQKASREIRGW
jgi:putative transposase